jgi:hypothetical protein
MAVFMSSCGQTYQLQSISVTPSYINLAGSGAEQQFVVTATYTNSKTNVVTLKSSYQIDSSPLNTTTPGVAPLSSLNYNNSGLVEVVGPACTFVPTTSGTTTTYGDSPYTFNVKYTEGSVTVTAVANIDVANAPGCDGQS